MTGRSAQVTERKESPENRHTGYRKPAVTICLCHVDEYEIRIAIDQKYGIWSDHNVSSSMQLCDAQRHIVFIFGNCS